MIGQKKVRVYTDPDLNPPKFDWWYCITLLLGSLSCMLGYIVTFYRDNGTLDLSFQEICVFFFICPTIGAAVMLIAMKLFESKR